MLSVSPPDLGVRPPQLTPLLPNRVLDGLERLRLRPRQRLTSRARGEHLGGKGGTSTEFCDYRDYAAGDDLRFVDWNIFGRLHRPYLKVFHREEERHALIVVDTSTSMRFEGKLARAQALAAAFGAMGLRGGERVSVCAPASVAPARLPPCAGRGSRGKLFAFIENLAAGGDQGFEESIAAALKTHAGRGVAVLLSDFLSGGDFGRAFNRVAGAGLEIFGVQILGASERDPAAAVAGDLRLVDSETAGVLDLSAAGDLLALYQEYRAAHEHRLGELCRQRGGRFLSIGADEPLETVLFDHLRRQGWIG